MDDKGGHISSREEKGGAARFRPWQRLRGQPAFQRARNSGVYRHSAAALVRILPPWEQELQKSQKESTKNSPKEADSVAGAEQPSHPRGEASGRGLPVLPTGRRLGVVASRKVGNAVVRNRAKRVWREVFRLNQQQLPIDCDVLVIVRKGAAQASRAEVEALFLEAAQRARRAFVSGGKVR